MIDSFRYQALPMRVVFGPGTVSQLPAEVDALRLERVLVICTPGHSATGGTIVEVLGPRAAGVLAEARMHVPVDLARRACDLATAIGADGCLAVGGGSAVGLGKAVALEHNLPLVAVPTTYAGSEMTPIWGLTRDGVKQTGRDLRVLPASVVYDPELTLSLPVPISVVSGMNAVAHGVEALYAPDASPILSLMAEEGVRTMLSGLRGVDAAPGAIDARSEAMLGAWLCGAVLGATTMSLHHKLCHTLGGTLDLPHAETHTAVLPYVLAFNAPSVPHAVAAISRALGCDRDPARELWELIGRLGGPRSLRQLGMAEADIPRIADLVLNRSYGNPRPVDRAGLQALLREAWAGATPESSSVA